ncbi:MAG: hypothetical protein H6978_02925 [Gammaproteobacteria bacterium]|nr:hypothetical protein [Gammaproteobacteria bacterium]
MPATNPPPAGTGTATVDFAAHIEVLSAIIARRSDAVARIEALLNVQKSPGPRPLDISQLARQLRECFFPLPGVASDAYRMPDALEQVHIGNGFRPRPAPGNVLTDPAQMMERAFHLWRQTNWPGQKGRVRYANTVFNLYVLKWLAFLSMRVLDVAAGDAVDRLADMQHVLDALWESTPQGHPTLLRDARWLIPIAMSPVTDELHGYFDVAASLSQSLPFTEQLAIQQAAVVLGGGHLRTQLYHLARQKHIPLDDLELILSTRRSNALDVAMLTQGLVTLLQAYEAAVAVNDSAIRSALASAIFQGISPDPELFVNRIDLLAPYTMIEHQFVAVNDDGQAVVTASGIRHQQLLDRYRRLMGSLAPALYQDLGQFKPEEGRYSPYGVLFGFSYNLLDLMALKTLQHEAPIQFSLEDAFISGGADKVGWVNGWRKLPHIKAEVSKLFEYPHAFALQIHQRIEHALRIGADGDANMSADAGRLLVATADYEAAWAVELPARYMQSSDQQRVATGLAVAVDEKDLLACRLEGEYLVSYQTGNGWAAVSKDLLTEELGAGRNIVVRDLPAGATEVLRVMAGGLVSVVGE